MSIVAIFLIIALIMFILAAVNMPTKVNLVAVGLAFWVASALVGVLA